MDFTNTSERLAPVASEDRYTSLDIIRGAALSGVLLVNLLDCFRVSLFERILNFHTHSGAANRWVDLLVAFLLEFKAFTLFSLMFGVGVGVQCERVAQAGRSQVSFLSRRFLALLLIGTVHMFLIWNGDILMLYAVCGLLLIPVLRLDAPILLLLGIAILLASPFLPYFGYFLPNEDAMHAQAAVATHIYSHGNFTEILRLRISEAIHFISPLLLDSLPRTFALMLLGISAWRTGIFKYPARYRSFLISCLTLGSLLGGVTTVIQLWSRETGTHLPQTLAWLYPYSVVFLAFAYGAGLLLLFGQQPTASLGWFSQRLAAAGRMALTNYVAQSVIFSIVFYGYGFGLFGRLGSAITALGGLAVFFVQILISDWWLEKFRFGPIEWLWRSLTYGSRQPPGRVQSG